MKLNHLWPFRGRSSQRQTRLLAMIEALDVSDDERKLQAMIALVQWLRPRRMRRPAPARARLLELTDLLSREASARARLYEALRWLIVTKQPLRLLSDTGILASEGFFSGLSRRLSAAVLPEELNPQQLKDVVNLIFPRRNDYLWIEAIDDNDWIRLLDSLQLGESSPEPAPTALPLQILEALQVVSYRIAAMGLEGELVRNHPDIERYESPFLTQNVELRQFIDEHRAAMLEQRKASLDDKHLLVLLEQCELVIAAVRKQAARSGASVSLTILLVRLSQHIERLKLLLRLLNPEPGKDLQRLRVRLFKQLVRAENRRNRIGELWRQTVDLLATRIVSNASKAGERYITSGRRDYFALFWSATGAGFIVVLAATLKLTLYDTLRSPFGEILVFSSVYVLAFLLMYLLHFSLATKQPAMTAHVIAQAIENGGPRQLDKLTELVVSTFRSQFIAVLGNLIVAVPLAALAAHLWHLREQQPYLSPEAAQHLLADANPLSLHVWIWSAITGLCLFATGLISGYYDNKAVYERMPQRIAQLRWLRRLSGRRGAAAVARYFEQHFGGLAGSVFFGLMLGSVGALGRVFGLPLNTLHVTFTSANCAYALAALDQSWDWRLLLQVATGVSLIGLLNLGVSFALALYVAMRSQRQGLRRISGLGLAVLHHLLRRPQDFFWPPRAMATEKSEAPSPK